MRNKKTRDVSEKERDQRFEPKVKEKFCLKYCMHLGVLFELDYVEAMSV